MIADNLKDKFPAEYLQYWNCCKPPIRGYAGTIIFTRIKPLNVYYDIGIPKHDREGRTITLEFEKFFYWHWGTLLQKRTRKSTFWAVICISITVIKKAQYCQTT